VVKRTARVLPSWVIGIVVKKFPARSGKSGCACALNTTAFGLAHDEGTYHYFRPQPFKGNSKESFKAFLSPDFVP